MVGGLVYTAFQARFSIFHGGDGFYGYRHGLEFLACAAPPSPCRRGRMGRVAQALIGPVLALQLAAFTVGSISNGFFVLPRRRLGGQLLLAGAAARAPVWCGDSSQSVGVLAPGSGGSAC